MLSTSIFGTDGKRYNQTAVFGPTFTLNNTALHEYGLPHLTGSNAWGNMTACWSVSPRSSNTGYRYTNNTFASFLLIRLVGWLRTACCSGVATLSILSSKHVRAHNPTGTGWYVQLIIRFCTHSHKLYHSGYATLQRVSMVVVSNASGSLFLCW